ncbi:MAG: hypothetical protein AAF153_02425 [Pseudomonadota bacterium]
MARIDNFNVIGIIKANMHHGSKQMEVINDNLSRAHVPGEFSNYLEPFDASELRSASPTVTMAVTDGDHLPGEDQGIKSYFPIKQDRDLSQVTPNGNNIVITDQVQQLGQNKLNYTASVGIYIKLRDILRKAIES